MLSASSTFGSLIFASGDRRRSDAMTMVFPFQERGKCLGPNYILTVGPVTSEPEHKCDSRGGLKLLGFLPSAGRGFKRWFATAQLRKPPLPTPYPARPGKLRLGPRRPVRG